MQGRVPGDRDLGDEWEPSRHRLRQEEVLHTAGVRLSPRTETPYRRASGNGKAGETGTESVGSLESYRGAPLTE